MGLNLSQTATKSFLAETKYKCKFVYFFLRTVFYECALHSAAILVYITTELNWVPMGKIDRENL